MAEFLRTHDIFSSLNTMLREAEDFILIVSPYINLDGEQTILLKKAAANGVRILIIYRLDSNDTAVKLQELSDLRGVKIIGCPELHAKIYATEDAAIMASKNLTTRKHNCSIEIGILYENGEEFYDSLIETVMEIKEIPNSQVLFNNSEPLPKGYCIRCRQQIDLNICHPLCKECFDVWGQFCNEDYEENYCHFCGKRIDGISFRKPVESGCYQEYLKKCNSRFYSNRFIPL